MRILALILVLKVAASLWVDPTSRYVFHDNVKLFSEEDAQHLKECHAEKFDCVLPKTVAQKHGLEAGHVIYTLADEKHRAPVTFVIEEVVDHSDSHVKFSHSQPTLATIFKELHIRVLDRPPKDHIQTQDTYPSQVVSHRSPAASLEPISPSANLYRDGPNFDFVTDEFVLTVNGDGLQKLTAIFKASAAIQLGVEGSGMDLKVTHNFLKYALTLASWSFPVGPVPVSISINFGHWVDAALEVHTPFNFDFGFQATGICRFGVNYVRNEGWSGVWDFSVPRDYWGSFDRPAVADSTLTFTLKDNVELAVMVGVGVFPIKLDLIGPFIRIMPGVRLTRSSTSWSIDYLLSGKVGIKGPSWQTAWFKFSCEWSKDYDFVAQNWQAGVFSVSDDVKKVVNLVKAIKPALGVLQSISATVVQVIDDTILAPVPVVPAVVTETLSISVMTGTVALAGTNAELFIQFTLEDTAATVTDRFWLPNSGDLNQGSVDLYNIKVPVLSGHIKTLRLGRTSGLFNDWFVDRVVIVRAGATRTYIFNKWIQTVDNFRPGSSTLYSEAVNFTPQTVIDATTDYVVSVLTGNVPDGATDADVNIQVMGWLNGAAPTIAPQQIFAITDFSGEQHWDNFEKGNVDSMAVKAVPNAGALSSVIITTDGSGLGSDWYLDNVQIINTKTGRTFEFKTFGKGWVKDPERKLEVQPSRDYTLPTPPANSSCKGSLVCGWQTGLIVSAAGVLGLGGGLFLYKRRADKKARRTQLTNMSADGEHTTEMGAVPYVGHSDDAPQSATDSA